MFFRTLWICQKCQKSDDDYMVAIPDHDYMVVIPDHDYMVVIPPPP